MRDTEYGLKAYLRPSIFALLAQFGPQISRSHASRTHFFAQGLSGTDDPTGDPPMYTLEHLMQINGHDFIDVLKVE